MLAGCKTKDDEFEVSGDTNEHTNDFVHPDASGYELITPYVIDFMRSMTPCNQTVLEAVLG